MTEAIGKYAVWINPNDPRTKAAIGVMGGTTAYLNDIAGQEGVRLCGTWEHDEDAGMVTVGPDAGTRHGERWTCDAFELEPRSPQPSRTRASSARSSPTRQPRSQRRPSDALWEQIQTAPPRPPCGSEERFHVMHPSYPNSYCLTCGWFRTPPSVT